MKTKKASAQGFSKKKLVKSKVGSNEPEIKAKITNGGEKFLILNAIRLKKKKYMFETSEDFQDVLKSRKSR